MRDFNILHIADFHSTRMNERNTALLRGWEEHIERLSSQVGIDLIVATGDLGDHGKEKTLSTGFERLKLLTKAAATTDKMGRTNSPPVVITPGNHDVEWPSTSKDFHKWKGNKRFEKYVLLCPKEYIRPSLLEEERHANGPDANKTHRWYYFNESGDVPVFVVAISSVDLSGTPIHALEDTIFESITTPKKAPHLQWLTADIPWVDPRQMENLKLRCQKLRRVNRSPGRRFGDAIRIAVLHHPLTPLWGEQECRPFDVVANGCEVLAKLSDLGFHAVLYGHKHRLGCHVNYGTWIHYSDQDSTHVGEIQGVVGGHLILGEKDTASNERGFQMVSIRRGDSKLGAQRADVLLRTFRMTPIAESKPRLLLTVGADGRTRWLHQVEPTRACLTRGSKPSEDLARIVQQIERSFVRRAGESLRELYSSVDDLISSSMEVMQQFCEGTRAVDKKFLDHMRRVAPSARALYFVDFQGYGSWFQPNLLHLLCLLFKLYLLRNPRIRVSPWEQGRWDHCPPVQATRDRLGRRETPQKCQKQVRTESKPRLSFDLARILIWRENSLCMPPGRMLVRLHGLFDVPLFWLDPAIWQGEFTKRFTDVPPRDFHVEWHPRLGRRFRPYGWDDTPSYGLYYDSKLEDRVPGDPKEMWGVYKKLLKHQGLKLASDVVGS